MRRLLAILFSLVTRPDTEREESRKAKGAITATTRVVAVPMKAARIPTFGTT
jgi:hypothetical protein